MRALLLGAGLGTRLRPLADDRPKCMVELVGKPVLLRNVEWLRSQGIRELAVNLHYLPGTIRDFFGDGSRFGVQMQYSFEPQLLGTAGAVRAAANLLLPAPFLVVYADNLISADLDRMRREHKMARAILTVALFHRDDTSQSGVVTLDANDRLTSFAEKTGRVTSGWVNAGLLVCEQRVLNYIPNDGAADFGHDVIPRMIESGEMVCGYRMLPHETLRWIDTVEDFRRTNAELSDASH
ncbi:MAG: nucleotidyltransferase family protein [Actinobacteria bacterium]|nr:MAG: nucleotidyltransferase family protein [Actinomycetota bacterium]